MVPAIRYKAKLLIGTLNTKIKQVCGIKLDKQNIKYAANKLKITRRNSQTESVCLMRQLTD